MDNEMVQPENFEIYLSRSCTCRSSVFSSSYSSPGCVLCLVPVLSVYSHQQY